MEPATTRVLIVDDHPLVRASLRAQLDGQAGVEIVGTAAEGAIALDAARSLRPDVVVLDIRLPDISGFEVANRLRAQLPRARVLFLTMHDDEEHVLQAVECGAAGYLLKCAHGGELVQALRRLGRHQPYFSAGVAQHLVRRYVEVAQRRRGAGLAPRERRGIAST